MQINHPLMTGLLVETIYILGHEILNIGLRFQLAQRQMSRIGPGARDVGPPLVTARPVSFAYSSITQKLTVLDRLTGSPCTSRITIGRYARALADTGSGQHHEPRVLKNKVPEQPHAGLQRHTYSSEWQVGEPKTAQKASASLCPATADSFSLSRTGIPSSIGMSSNLVIAIMPGNTSKTESKQTRSAAGRLTLYPYRLTG